MSELTWPKRLNPSGAHKYYWTLEGRWECDDFPPPLTPTVPITDFFTEDRAVELLRELAHLNNCEMEGILAPTPDEWYEAFNRVGEFLHELNKDK